MGSRVGISRSRSRLFAVRSGLIPPGHSIDADDDDWNDVHRLATSRTVSQTSVPCEPKRCVSFRLIKRSTVLCVCNATNSQRPSHQSLPLLPTTAPPPLLFPHPSPRSFHPILLPRTSSFAKMVSFILLYCRVAHRRRLFHRV